MAVPGSPAFTHSLGLYPRGCATMGRPQNDERTSGAAMDFRDTAEETSFRQQVREFIRTELPDELKPENAERRPPGEIFGRGGPGMKEWTKSLAARKWIAPA